jgi:hypothetical protein
VHFVLAFWGPSLLTIKIGGRDVRSEERDTCKPKKFSGGGRRAALPLRLAKSNELAGELKLERKVIDVQGIAPGAENLQEPSAQARSTNILNPRPA